MKLTHAPILVVENDPNDAVLLQRAFRSAGFDVSLRIVHGGRDAIAYLRGDGAYADREQHPLPLLLVVELKMPTPTGFEVLRWVREQPLLRRLPCVVLTGSREQADVEAAYEAGASSYLVKPVAFEALQTMLTTFGHYWLNFNTPPDLEGVARLRRASGAG